MSKEEKFLNECIEIANETSQEYGFAHCAIFKDELNTQGGKYDFDKLCSLAKEQGYKFVEMSSLSQLNMNKVPDASKHFVLVPLDTPTTA